MPFLKALLLVCLSSLTLAARLDKGDAPRTSFLRHCYTRIIGDRYSAQEPQPCGEGKCLCTDTEADCSGHAGHLTYIPKLPDGIQLLDFSKNALGTITREDFFQNVTDIKTLFLAENGLSRINEMSLRRLWRLEDVCLDANKFSYSTLVPVFSVPALAFLLVKDNGLSSPPQDFFRQFDLEHLWFLGLQGNHLQRVDLEVFQPLKNLEHLDLHSNEIGSQFNGNYLRNLDYMDLGLNGMFDFPKTCGPNNTSFYPSLTVLSFDYNEVQFIHNPVCLPRLKILSLSGNKIVNFLTDMFSLHRFPSLKELLLDDMQSMPQTYEKGVFSNKHLKKLLLSINVDFPGEVADAGCTELTHLTIDSTQWDVCDQETFHLLFSGLQHLRHLDLSYCHLAEIPVQSLRPFTKSLATLHLGSRRLDSLGNKIMSVPDGVFDDFINLTVLSLAGNDISVVRKTAFSDATRRRLRRLDLANNPFQCTCDLLSFRGWLISDPVLFGFSPDNYLCSNLRNTSVGAQFLVEQQCLLTRDESLLIIVVFSLLMLSLALGALFHRYRWHIRLMLYETRRNHSDGWRRLQEQHFLYDVFVCYDREDLDWVLAHLLPELEGRLGLRLCVHERDFIPGHNIVDNISDCVKQSKKTLMVFSKHFAHSPWCQFELNFCLGHVIENADTLLIVMLHDIPSRDLTPAMMAVMKTTTYIEWADSTEAVASFWGRLHIALREILPVA